MPELPATDEGASPSDSEAGPPWPSLAYLVLAVLAVVAIGRLWLPPVRSSLWLDETGTVWLVKGSFLDSMSNALNFQGGSPLFYVVAWTTRAIAGGSELALRTPSLAGMALAAYLLLALGRRLFDRATGAIAAVVFVALPSIAFAAVDARPYALALAAIVGSALALTRWLESGRTRDGIVYALTVAVTVYLHYLLALALVAHGVYLLFRLGSRTRVAGRQLAYVYGAATALLVPAVPTLWRVMNQRSLLSNPFPQTPLQVFSNLWPTNLLWIVVAGFALAGLFWPARRAAWNARDGAVPFLLAWAAIPALVLVILSEATPTDVTVPRYFLSIVPALALLIAVALRRLGNAWAQVAIVGAFVLWSASHFFMATHTAEDWRGAAALERATVTDPDTPVLLFSGFIEGHQLEWLEDDEKASYLNAPAAAYPLDGREPVPLPFGLDETNDDFVNRVTADLEGSPSFVLVTRGDSFNQVFVDHFEPLGYTSTLLGNFGGQVSVYEFTR